MALPGRPERYRFGPFELQPDNRRLLKYGATISLRPRAFDLLVALVDRAGHLITKDELLNRMWPKTVVDEAAFHVQVSALRKVVGSDATARALASGAASACDRALAFAVARSCTVRIRTSKRREPRRSVN
jgi:Transcriptional regulatory protein, C terminal